MVVLARAPARAPAHRETGTEGATSEAAIGRCRLHVTSILETCENEDYMEILTRRSANVDVRLSAGASMFRAMFAGNTLP